MRLDRIEAAGLASINSIKGQHAVITLRRGTIAKLSASYVVAALVMLLVILSRQSLLLCLGMFSSGVVGGSKIWLGLSVGEAELKERPSACSVVVLVEDGCGDYCQPVCCRRWIF